MCWTRNREELALPKNIVEQEGYRQERILDCWTQMIDRWQEIRSMLPAYEPLGISTSGRMSQANASGSESAPGDGQHPGWRAMLNVRYRRTSG